MTAHGGHPGYHLKLYNKHWKRLMVTEGIVGKQVIDTTKQEEYAQLTMIFSCGEFCSCLFLHQSNNRRYKCPEEQQHNAFLMVDNKYTKKIVEAKNLLEDWQGTSRAQPTPIANKEEEGGMAFIKQGNTAAVKKYNRGKCHGYGMVNDHFLSKCKVVSK